MSENACTKSFGDFDFGYDETAVHTSALPIWYDEVRRTPFASLTNNDIARACRQEVCLQELIPCCLQRLRQNLFQGDEWPGQLAEGLTFVSEKYWTQYPEQEKQFVRYLYQVWLVTGDDDQDWNSDELKRRRQRK